MFTKHKSVFEKTGGHGRRELVATFNASADVGTSA
jgi:hypothetical protein